MTELSSKRELVREERRKQILEAALAVFAQKGFHATNVSDVAARAGVSQGTIYWYFESKDELFTAAILSFFKDFGHQIQVGMELCETASDKLRALAQSMEAFVQEAEGLLMLFFGYWTASPNREEAGRLWVDLLVEYKDVLVRILEEGIENGEFRPVDAEALVWMVMGAYDGLAAYDLLMGDLNIKRASEAFIETLLYGLLKS